MTGETRNQELWDGKGDLEIDGVKAAGVAEDGDDEGDEDDEGVDDVPGPPEVGIGVEEEPVGDHPQDQLHNEDRHDHRVHYVLQ